jgi:hypothetical protein
MLTCAQHAPGSAGALLGSGAPHLEGDLQVPQPSLGRVLIMRTLDSFGGRSLPLVAEPAAGSSRSRLRAEPGVDSGRGSEDGARAESDPVGDVSPAAWLAGLARPGDRVDELVPAAYKAYTVDAPCSPRRRQGAASGGAGAPDRGGLLAQMPRADR